MTAANPDATYWVRLRIGNPGDYLEYDVASTDPVDPSDPVQVLDDLRIGWAAPTSEPWPAQPAPLSCSFGLYTEDVANVAAYAAVGTPVEVSIYDGDPGAGGDRWFTFAGRVASSSATPFRRGSTQATVFRVSALDYLVDLSEFVVTFEDSDFPAGQDTGDRLAAISAASVAAGGPSIGLGDWLSNPSFQAASYGTTDVLSVLSDMLRQLNSGQYGQYERHYVRPDYTLGAMACGTFLVEHYGSYVEPDANPGRFVIDPNRVTNTFETDLSGWVATDGAAMARVTSPVSTGEGALRVTGAGGLAGAVYPNAGAGQYLAVTPGQSYTVRAKIRAATTPRTASVTIMWYTAALGLISLSTSTAVVSATTGYTQASITATAPATAAKAFVWVRAVSAVGDVQYWDDPVFTDGVPVLGIDFPGTIAGVVSQGLIDGCQVDLAATQWASRKRTSPTRVTTTGPVGTFVAEHSPSDATPIKLELTNDFYLMDLSSPEFSQRQAEMYLPPPEAVQSWEVSKFLAYAGPLIDDLGAAGGRLREWFPDHASDANASKWPVRPVVITNFPDPINLNGGEGIYAGQLTGAELSIIRRKFRVEFSLARRLPTVPEYVHADTASYDFVERVFPLMDYDHVDPDLTFYNARLARRY